MTTRLAVLNDMADTDFTAALDRHAEWGLTTVDLRASIFGKTITELSPDDAGRAAALITERGLDVHCFSTGIFFLEVEAGEQAWRETHLNRVDDVLRTAEVLAPSFIRLIAAHSRKLAETPDVVAYLDKEHPWIFDVYGEAVDRIRAAGFVPSIENEAHDCIFREPEEILAFYDRLGREDLAFTWDVTNHWSNGIFPTVEIYEQLKPLIRYYHVKGGQDGDGDRRLTWNSRLSDSTWPVVEITNRVVADGVSPVICLNPSQHGTDRPGYDYSSVTADDLGFLRGAVDGVV